MGCLDFGLKYGYSQPRTNEVEIIMQKAPKCKKCGSKMGMLSQSDLCYKCERLPKYKIEITETQYN